MGFFFTEDSSSWLINSSFQTSIIPATPVIEVSSDSSDNESVKVLPQVNRDAYEVVSLDSDSSCEAVPLPAKRAKLRKTSKHSRTSKNKPKVKYELDVENVYFEDRTRDRGNCHVDTLCARARPRYLTNCRPLGFVAYQMQNKKSTLQRYWVAISEAKKKSKKPDTVIKRGTSKKSDEPVEESVGSLNFLPNAEEEQKSRTKEFNEKLGESPHDVDLWLRYIKFQDLLQTFEESQSRENYAAFCQRKLSIAERGLERNPDSKQLLREKLYIMSELYPADQFSGQIEALVNKDTGNIMLWQSFIMATQTSVAMCTVPKVMSLYNRFFGTLRLWSRTSSRNHDERLLGTCYCTSIFSDFCVVVFVSKIYTFRNCQARKHGFSVVKGSFRKGRLKIVTQKSKTRLPQQKIITSFVCLLFIVLQLFLFIALEFQETIKH